MGGTTGVDQTAGADRAGSSSGVAAVLWPGEPRRKRGPRPKFSLDDVVDAAIAIADAEGLSAVTMQRVADELGSAKMALYRYVPGKAELAALMLDRALGLPPTNTSGRWRRRLRSWTVTMHERMSARPWTLELTVGRRTPGPHELAWLEQGVAALRSAPLDGAERLDTLALLANHVRGSVEQAAAIDQPETSLAESLEPILTAHADRFPQTVAAFTEAAATGRRDDAFSFGLDRILDGVAALIARRG